MKNIKLQLLISFFVISITSNCYAISDDKLIFDDSPLKEALILPNWFKLSFLEISDEIKEAKERKKKGLIIYFGQKYCPYCKAHITNNWEQKDIVKYTQKNFDVIAINVKGQRPVINTDGKTYTEKTFSALKKTNFTPSLIFLYYSRQRSITFTWLPSTLPVSRSIRVCCRRTL